MGKRDERLLADFLALFYYEKELDEGAPQERPIPQRTDPKALDLLYEALPARLPRLYEQLILSYRWPAVELRKFALLANLPGQDRAEPGRFRDPRIRSSRHAKGLLGARVRVSGRNCGAWTALHDRVESLKHTVGTTIWSPSPPPPGPSEPQQTSAPPSRRFPDCGYSPRLRMRCHG